MRQWTDWRGKRNGLEVSVDLKKWMLLACMALATLACTGKREANIDICGINYTSAGIPEFSVNGYWGGGVYPHGGGGKFVCCVTVPNQWRPGLQVTVRWTEEGVGERSQKERVVPIPEYTEKDIGFFAVHFLPGDVVKVLVTMKTANHSDWVARENEN